MKRNNTIFSYMEQIFMVFGFTVLCLVVFVRLFGISAQEISTIYELGEVGLTVGTLLQFFLVSVLIVTLRYLFFWLVSGRGMESVGNVFYMLWNMCDSQYRCFRAERKTGEP